MPQSLSQNPQERRDAAYEKALKYLKIRLHTTAELKNKLRRGGFSPEAVEKTLSQLTVQGYLNDIQFGEAFLDSLIKYKTFGFYGLRAKLLKRGLERSDVDKLLDQFFSLEKEKEIARKFIKRKGTESAEKLARGLASRGFRSEVIAEFLRPPAGDEM